VVVHAKANVNGKDVEPPARLVSVWRDQTVRAYRDAGLFSEVRTGSAPADVQAEVTLKERGQTSIALAVITGLTLYLVPSSATSEVTAKTELRDRNGTIVGTFEKSETLTMWQQLFLIVATPFSSPSAVAEATIYDLSRATISEASARGLFGAPAAPSEAVREPLVAP
jgi:hypothetical protein